MDEKLKFAKPASPIDFIDDVGHQWKRVIETPNSTADALGESEAAGITHSVPKGLNLNG